jgi:hypothetical protein
MVGHSTEGKLIRHNCPLSDRDIQAVQDLQSTQTQILSELQKIKAAVVGDEYNDGLKQRMDRAEKDLQFHRKLQWGIIGVGTFMGLVTGFKAVVEWVPSIPKDIILFYMYWL